MTQFVLLTAIAVAHTTFTVATNPILNVDIGSTPQLNNAAGIVNKNTVLKNNNVVISASTVAAVRDDTVSMQEAATDLPPGVTMTGDEEPIADQDGSASGATEAKVYGTRLRFCFRLPSGDTRCGWRYPIGYWYDIGQYKHQSECEFGQSYGAYFYC